MRQALWVIGVLAIGCGKKSETPKAGSGTAATAADAAAVAVVIDAPAAEPAGSGSAGSGSAAAANEPGNTAIPEEGFVLATVAKEKLVLAKLDRKGVHVEHELPISENADFAWLDASTLVVREPYGDSDKVHVQKIVDGKVGETVELGDDWKTSTLLVTKTNEVWVERCTVEPEGPEECPKKAFQRIWPSKKTGKKAPPGVDEQRVARSAWARGLQRVALNAAAPADAKLEKVKFTVKDEYANQKVVAVKCTRGAETATYPKKDGYDPAYGYTAKAFRWVLAEPAIYEVTADTLNPVGQNEKPVDYFIACKPDALDGFISFGGPVWGEYKEADAGGKWTFRVGATDVGTLDGGALRANR
jgi:hypothetical protein